MYAPMFLFQIVASCMGLLELSVIRMTRIFVYSHFMLYIMVSNV